MRVHNAQRESGHPSSPLSRFWTKGFRYNEAKVCINCVGATRNCKESRNVLGKQRDRHSGANCLERKLPIPPNQRITSGTLVHHRKYLHADQRSRTNPVRIIGNPVDLMDRIAGLRFGRRSLPGCEPRRNASYILAHFMEDPAFCGHRPFVCRNRLCHASSFRNRRLPRPCHKRSGAPRSKQFSFARTLGQSVSCSRAEERLRPCGRRASVGPDAVRRGHRISKRCRAAASMDRMSACRMPLPHVRSRESPDGSRPSK